MKKNIVKLLFPLLKIYNFIQIKKYNINVLNTYDSLKLLNEKICSISRFGDGEFDLINGKSLKFQKYNAELAKRLKEILEVKENCENLKIAIPCAYKYLNEFNAKSQIFWIMYFRKNRKTLFNILNKKYQYLDSQITRIYINRKNLNQCKFYFSEWKKIWNEKELLIVEGEKSRFGVGNDLFDNAKSVSRILCPAENAFDKYNEILKTIKKYSENKLVLLVLGPTATVLAYDLAILGIRALDIGNMDMEYEWFKNNADEKIKIEGKYSLEVNDGRIVNGNYDSKYKNQILLIIK